MSDTAKNYGRPSGEPKKSELKVGRSCVDSGTTKGNKGQVPNLPSIGKGLGGGKVVSGTTEGNKGATFHKSSSNGSAPRD